MFHLHRECMRSLAGSSSWFMHCSLTEKSRSTKFASRTLLSWQGKSDVKGRRIRDLQKWDQSFGLFPTHKPEGKAAPAQRKSWLHILCQVTFCSPRLLVLKDIHIFTTFLKVISAVSPAEPLNINWTAFQK